MNGQDGARAGRAGPTRASGGSTSCASEGKWLIGDQLAPPRRAQTIRVRGGKTLVTDGPFAETKEAVGGFDLIEADSFEEAVEIAADAPDRGVRGDRGQAALGELTSGATRVANSSIARMTSAWATAPMLMCAR